MTKTRSRWSERRAPGAALALALGLAVLGGVPAGALAQDDDADAACRAFLSPSTVSECRLAVGAARVIQPRLAIAMFGANPVPGTASTLGMRLGSFPRLSLAFQVTGAPTDLPPVLDRASPESGSAFLTGFAVDASVGVLTGLSPLPTVGGVLSLDLIGRLGLLPLPGDGFQDGATWGWALGARVGALRESFTLPGVSLTATYSRLGGVTFGDPDGATDGFFDGAVTDLRAALAATKRLGSIGLTVGVAMDRYSSDLVAGFRDFPGGPQLIIPESEAVHDRWSAYADAGFTLLVFQGSLELGWQDAPVPDGIPSGVEVDPVGWFGGLAFRISI